MNSANKYKEMAMDELKHATYEHEWATKEIAKISSVYDAPMDMMEKWEKSHKEYVEKVAWIRQMLSM
jgi:hypothetical protein